jgi:hypothetical protein
MKKVDKFKCELVAAAQYQKLSFAPSLSKLGFWRERMAELAAAPDKFLKLRGDDTSSVQQAKHRAKDLGLKLLFAREGEFVFIKAVKVEGDQKRLLLLLREPRTVNDLKAKTLELDIDAELKALKVEGVAELNAKLGTWKLTEKGLGLIA